MPLLVTLLLLAAPGWAPSMEGTWRHAGGEAELQGVTDAVDRTVNSMAAPMRPFARKRMHRTINAVGVYAIALDGDVLRIAKDGTEPRPVHLDGATRDEVGGDGKTAQVRADLLDDGVRHHWTRDDSTGSTSFRLADGGARLVVERVIDSSWFNEPVRFTTTYRR